MGPDTWCSYIRGIYHDQDLSPAKPPRIPPNLAGFLKARWAQLCERELLEHCVLGATQNQNESFNGLIWKHCPKTDFSGWVSVQMATLLATLSFNGGYQSLVPLLEGLDGEGVGPYCIRYLHANDDARLKMAAAKVMCQAKKGRKSVPEVEEQLVAEKEGVSYEAGSF